MTKKTLVGFILDETGSMQDVKQQTVNGFNEYVTTLKAEADADKIRFALTKFNSEETNVVHDGVRLKKVALLTDESYQPTAMTPLYDAIGLTVRALEHKIAGKKRNVLVVIQTDGQENHSREFTQQDVFDLVTRKKAEGWTFVFLGADQDAWLTGQLLGMDKGNVMSYDSAETKGAFKGLTRATVEHSRSGGGQTDSFWDS